MNKTDFITKIIAVNRNPKTTIIDSVMSKPFFSLSEYMQMSEASELMLRKEIKHLVVTEGEKWWGF